MAVFLDPRLWDDPRFLSLDDGSRCIYLYALLGPERYRLPGLFRDSILSVADSLKRPMSHVEHCFKELESRELLVVDREAKVVCVPHAPTLLAVSPNPNQLKSWWYAWRGIPTCDIKFSHVANLVAAVNQNNERVRQAWRCTFQRVLDNLVTASSGWADMAIPRGNVVQLSDHRAKTQSRARGNNPERLDRSAEPLGPPPPKRVPPPGGSRDELLD